MGVSVENEFNPEPKKQAQEVFFSRKRNKTNHSSLNFNKEVFTQLASQKHLAIVLYTKLAF